MVGPSCGGCSAHSCWSLWGCGAYLRLHLDSSTSVPDWLHPGLAGSLLFPPPKCEKQRHALREGLGKHGVAVRRLLICRVVGFLVSQFAVVCSKCSWPLTRRFPLGEGLFGNQAFITDEVVHSMINYHSTVFNG